MNRILASPSEEPKGKTAMGKHVACECGEATGERCSWTGPVGDTVVIEWMPEYLRASHEAARNPGIYPHNGALRLRCERSCAARLEA